jgi:hypothetical protein
MAVQNPSHHLEVQDTKQVLFSAKCGQCLRMGTLLTKASAMNGNNQTNSLFLNQMILILKPFEVLKQYLYRLLLIFVLGLAFCFVFASTFQESLLFLVFSARFKTGYQAYKYRMAPLLFL